MHLKRFIGCDVNPALKLVNLAQPASPSNYQTTVADGVQLDEKLASPAGCIASKTKRVVDGGRTLTAGRARRSWTCPRAKPLMMTLGHQRSRSSNFSTAAMTPPNTGYTDGSPAVNAVIVADRSGMITSILAWRSTTVQMLMTSYTGQEAGPRPQTTKSAPLRKDDVSTKLKMLTMSSASASCAALTADSRLSALNPQPSKDWIGIRTNQRILDLCCLKRRVVIQNNIS